MYPYPTITIQNKLTGNAWLQQELIKIDLIEEDIHHQHHSDRNMCNCNTQGILTESKPYQLDMDTKATTISGGKLSLKKLQIGMSILSC